LAQTVGGKGGAVAAPAVKHDFAVGIGHLVGNVVFQNAAPDAARAGQVAGPELVLLAHVNQHAGPGRVGKARLHVVRGRFGDAGFGVGAQVIERFGERHGSGFLVSGLRRSETKIRKSASFFHLPASAAQGCSSRARF
jgi:hypothetical protein